MDLGLVQGDEHQDFGGGPFILSSSVEPALYLLPKLLLLSSVYSIHQRQERKSHGFIYWRMSKDLCTSQATLTGI